MQVRLSFLSVFLFLSVCIELRPNQTEKTSFPFFVCLSTCCPSQTQKTVSFRFVQVCVCLSHACMHVCMCAHAGFLIKERSKNLSVCLLSVCLFYVCLLSVCCLSAVCCLSVFDRLSVCLSEFCT
jgi:hypothetical protein